MRITLATILAVISIVLLSFVGGYKFAMRDIDKSHAELLGQQQAYTQISNELASLQIDYKNQSDLLAKYETEFSTKPKTGVIAVSGAKFGVKGKEFSEASGAKFYEIYLPDGDQKGPALGVVVLGQTVTTKAYDHDIEIVQGIERDKKTGRYTVLAKGYYVLKETNGKWRDKRFPLPITGGQVVVDPVNGQIERNKFWLRPRAHLGLQMTYPNKAPTPSVTLYPISYGQNPDVSKFRFLGVGLSGTQKKVFMSVVPVTVNLNSAIKFLHNTYVGPVMSFDQNGNRSYGAVLDVSF